MVDKALSSAFESARKEDWTTLENQLRKLELTVKTELSAMATTFMADLNALTELDLSVTGSGTFFESEPYRALKNRTTTALASEDYGDAYAKISQIKTRLDSDFWPAVSKGSTENAKA